MFSEDLLYDFLTLLLKSKTYLKKNIAKNKTSIIALYILCIILWIFESLFTDSFEIIISKNKTFGDLIEKITEKRFVERGVITLMLKNKMIFFDGSPENPDFNMFGDSDILSEESEKSEDCILELIYKEKEAGGGKEQDRIGIKNATNENLLIGIRYEAIQYGLHK